MKPLDALDPEIAAALESMPIGEIRADTLKEYRIPFEFPTSDAIEGSDRVVPGDPEVKVRVHRPKGVSGPLPCLYSMHGGGYVIGSYDMDNALFAELCPRVGMVGVSVDYRLAPETPYPGPLEDCYRGLEWTFEHADELGIDPSYVGVGGLSAGGGGSCASGQGPGRTQLALSAPQLSDARRSAGHRLESAQRPTGMEQSIERVRMALLPWRPLRHGRDPAHCFTSPRYRAFRAAPRFRVGRFRGRVP
jgi:acetyl esterase/lipase